MNLPPSPSRQARFFVIVAVIISASALGQALVPNRSRPLWDIALTPAVFICMAAAAALEERARTTPPLRRWATGLAILGCLIALGALYVTVCARGACFAV